MLVRPLPSGVMMVGHAALAFAIVAVAAKRRVSPARALVLAVVAGAAATVPDVDMVYALVGLLGAEGDVFALSRSFWGASTAVHRTTTHSIVVAVPAAVAMALWGVRGDRRWIARAGALGIGLALVAAAYFVTGTLAVVVMTAFVGAGLLVAAATRRLTDVRPGELLAVSLVGLISHPWGDLFTGEPPQLLYPLETTVFSARVTLSGSDVMHLLGAFAIELGALWLATLAYRSLRDDQVFSLGDPKAALAAGYALTVFVLPPPTLSLSYHFVFSIVAVAAVVALPNLVRPTVTGAGAGDGGESERRGRHLAGVIELRFDVEGVRGAWVTALEAVTVALVAYAIGYTLF